MKLGFSIFGTAHILAVLALTVFFSAIIIYLHSTANKGYSKNVFLIIGICILVNAIFWRVLLIFQGKFDISADLPCHLCGVIPYLLALYFFKPIQRLFDILYYWIITASSLALLIPDIQHGFPSAQFFAHFATHAMPLFGMLHLLINCNIRPSVESYNTAFLSLAIFALFIAFPIDLLTGGNYLYLFGAPAADFRPISLLPGSPWHLIPIGIFFYLLFRIVYLPVKASAVTEVAKVAL